MATSNSVATAHTHTNRLAGEKSPYLLQHQFNPVDWQPWGEAAFAEAERRGVPIFLSIGYSTCHWCHVMERESFEDAETARYLNEHFVSIKVDREERPDVDHIYMTFVQATTGQGGWPLNVFLTPERKPFFGGTYFPPDSRYGRPSFRQLLKHIQELWATRREDITNSAAQIHRQLADAASSHTPADLEFTPDSLRHAMAVLKRSYDPRHGGFGDAPKFPQPSQPRLLLRLGERFGDEEARGMVLTTCDRMAAGGIHDQLGGGFARYAVDAEWLVPHFEKMLYDNAQLVRLYLEAYVASGDARHAEVARDILTYVLRDLAHPEGGFYSAEDADSEGHEGKFYCWTLAELSTLLTADELRAATRYFGVTERGNFVDHSHPQPLPNQNVLSVVEPNLSAKEARLMGTAKEKLLAARAKRVRPHLDDKVLASWNGLMLAALAQAYAVLGDETYRLAAEKNVAFLRAKLWEPGAGAGATSRLHHRWRDGEHDEAELLEGYAFLLSGVLELYQSTLDPAQLEFAVALAEAMIAKFYDAQQGGFWQSGPAAGDLILRMKEEYDGAVPSGNSVAILALLELGQITGRKEFTAAAEKSLRLFASRLQQAPQAVPAMLAALDFSLQEPRRAVVAGDPASPGTRALLHAVHAVYQPNKVVSGIAGPVEAFARTLRAGKGALVYVCTGTACQAPTADPVEVKRLLK